MSRYAVVRDGQVENICLWDSQTEWQPPEGSAAVRIDGLVDIGWLQVDGGGFVPPPPEEQAETE